METYVQLAVVRYMSRKIINDSEYKLQSIHTLSYIPLPLYIPNHTQHQNRSTRF